MQTRPIKICDLLTSNSQILGQTLHHARLLAHINRKLQALLNPSLARHCIVANYANGILTLQTDSGSWATRLRYALPALRDALQQLPELDALKQIEVRIAPRSEPHTQTAQRPTLTPQSREIIRQCSAAIDDPGLRNALERLAACGTKRKGKQVPN